MPLKSIKLIRENFELARQLILEYYLGLWQDKMDKKCFLGVNFLTCSNHHLFSTML